MYRLLLAAMAILLYLQPAAAAEPQFVQLSPDTYMVVVKNYAGIFANAQTTKIKAIEAANAFAKKQGKVAIPLNLQEVPAGGPGHWPAVEYQFRVVSESDQEAQRTSLTPSPNMTVEVRSQTVPPPLPAAPQSRNEPADLYTQLLKLDDLRKRGLITDQEFDTLKSRLLESGAKP
jgi:hypothetical protein